MFHVKRGLSTGRIKSKSTAHPADREGLFAVRPGIPLWPGTPNEPASARPAPKKIVVLLRGLRLSESSVSGRLLPLLLPLLLVSSSLSLPLLLAVVLAARSHFDLRTRDSHRSCLYIPALPDTDFLSTA